MTAKATRRAVFLDRDGCISPDELGYNSDPSKYNLYPYTGPALRMLQNMGYLLFVVTNQSGIARGYFDIPALNRVHNRMKELLVKEGVRLKGVYFSPYFAQGTVPPFNIHHEDRKPGIGMFKRARQENPFNPGQSWMLGDRYTDIAFGKRAGMKSVLLLSGHGAEELLAGTGDWEYKPDFIVENLLTAARLIQMLHQ
jgi:histidinol-phosphate phosphatase family protein